MQLEIAAAKHHPLQAPLSTLRWEGRRPGYPYYTAQLAEVHQERGRHLCAAYQHHRDEDEMKSLRSLHRMTLSRDTAAIHRSLVCCFVVGANS